MGLEKGVTTILPEIWSDTAVKLIYNSINYNTVIIIKEYCSCYPLDSNLFSNISKYRSCYPPYRTLYKYFQTITTHIVHKTVFLYILLVFRYTSNIDTLHSIWLHFIHITKVFKYWLIWLVCSFAEVFFLSHFQLCFFLAPNLLPTHLKNQMGHAILYFPIFLSENSSDKTIY